MGDKSNRPAFGAFAYGASSSGPVASVFALTALALAAGGCDGCHASKPYTPYTLGDAPSASVSARPADAGAPTAAVTDAGSTLDAAAPPAFAPVKGSPPIGDGRTWPLDGGAVLDAPAGRAFATGLLADLDGDGKRDLLTWARAPDGLRGELLFAPGSKPGDARTIAALPDGLSIAGCTASASITQVGPRTILFDYEPHCGARARAVRWVTVLRVLAAAPVPTIGLELRVLAPFDGESLQISADARDRDDDGRDDIALKLTLTGAPRPLPFASATAYATLAFFDRPAGLSRDPTEPEASLKAQLGSLTFDARRKTSAPRIAGAAFALRRLHAMLCEEGGRALVSTNAGPIRCGDAKLTEDSTVAEIEAALNLADPVTALGALARLDAIGPRRKDVDTLVGKSLPSITATQLRKTTAVPSVERAPAYGPLAFDPGGDLMVHTVDKVIRVDHTVFGEAPIDAALLWPKRLKGVGDPPTWSLLAVEQRPDSPVLVARIEIQKGDTAVTSDLLLPIAAAAPWGASTHVPAELLGASSAGALVAVGGEVLAFASGEPPRVTVADALAAIAGAPVELGVARSPDGATIALLSSRGVLVATTKGAGRGLAGKLWTGLDADGARLCVPSNGGSRLACVIKGAAAIYEAR